MSSILFAGVSRTAGVLRFRTASDNKRFQQLIKLGDTDVEFAGVNASNKSEAAKELLARNFANGRADIDALLVSIARDDNTVKPTKTRTVKVRNVTIAPTEKKLSIEEANARVALTVKEITPERALQLLVNAMPKKRRSRKTQVEVA
jgi:hypothetical protein